MVLPGSIKLFMSFFYLCETKKNLNKTKSAYIGTHRSVKPRKARVYISDVPQVDELNSALVD